MKTYYLVYVYRGEIKIRECQRFESCSHSFEPIVAVRGHYKYTNIPDSPMVLQHGKIYCEVKGSIPESIRIIKNHYKDRVLQLERSIQLGKLVIGEDRKV